MEEDKVDVPALSLKQLFAEYKRASALHHLVGVDYGPPPRRSRWQRIKAWCTLNVTWRFRRYPESYYDERL